MSRVPTMPTGMIGAPVRSEALGLTGAAVTVPRDEWWQALADTQLDTLMTDAAARRRVAEETLRFAESLR